MRKKLALILSTVIIATTTLTGCGEKNISGEYTSTVNVVDLVDPETTTYLAEMGIDISSLTLGVKLSLDEEHNYTMELDPSNFKTEFSDIVTNNMTAILDNILAAEGLSRAELTNERAQFMGYESADAFITDLTNQMTASLTSSMDSLDQKFKDETITGTYEVTKDSVIFKTSGDNNEIELGTATLAEDGTITVSATTDTGTELSLTFNSTSTEKDK